MSPAQEVRPAAAQASEDTKEVSAITTTNIIPKPHTAVPPLGPNGKISFADKAAAKAQCREKYGRRAYLPADERRLPPMLYTYPGSGNTWSRLLIEYATGILTGSVYNDGSLREALPGEFKCNWEVSVVKVHPHTHPFSELYGGTFNSDDMKCKKGEVKRFERSILLIRNPFDSIWSEYQRRVSRSHVDGIPKLDFNWHRWQANAAAMSHSYKNTWAIEHAGIERSYKKEDYIYLKYEDLKDKNRRVETLRQIVNFLRYKNIDDERLECAFLLAESRSAHRSVDKSLVMTKDVAYIPEIACRMWTTFGEFAGKHGYYPWSNYTCDDYPPMPRMNVGSNGEYDRLWVTPGQKLIDFRTPATIALHKNASINLSVDIAEQGVIAEERRRKRMGEKKNGLRRANPANAIHKIGNNQGETLTVQQVRLQNKRMKLSDANAATA